jgi:hypothetical protein
VQEKKGEKVDINKIVNHNLGDGVRSIMEWKNLIMRPCKVFFMQVKTNFVDHLKLVWHLVFIMEFLVLGIRL